MGDTARRSSPVHIEPVPGQPAATATIDGDRTLLIADYHAGYEAGLRAEQGVEVPSRAPDRRKRLLRVLDRTKATRLVVLGDLMHSIGEPGGAERGELEVLFESLPPEVEVTVIKGNHDGLIETWLADDITVVAGEGIAVGDVGLCHGHTWPAPSVLDCAVVCLGHEHPCVRLEDELGGSRVERAWLRGRLDPAAGRDRSAYDDLPWLSDDEPPPQVVVLPAFNDLVGGTWINVADQSFLAPLLSDGVADGEAYLLDGTRLGPYRSV